MKTAFVTHCSDDWFYSGGCSKLIATANHFHPEVPFYVFNNIELNKLNSNYNGRLNWCNLNPVVSIELAKHYDRVVHFDSDSIILGKLDELLGCKSEILGVRNNNDFDTASKYSDPPVTVNGIPPCDYMNAGLVGSTSIDFWRYWIDMNFSIGEGLPYKEQDTLNLIIQKKKWSFTCLDSKDSNLHYGISCHHGKDGYWDSSKSIQKIGGDFMLNGKKVKVWHQAGGSQYFPKLNIAQFFSEECAKEINTILISGNVNYRKIVIQ